MSARQILYNHIAGGDQPAEVKTEMKPFLDHAAAAEPFRPEMARRLGLRAFTGRPDPHRPRHRRVHDPSQAVPAGRLRPARPRPASRPRPRLRRSTGRQPGEPAGPGRSTARHHRPGWRHPGRDSTGPGGPHRQLPAGHRSAVRALPALPLPPLPGEPGYLLGRRLRPSSPGWVFRHPTLSEGFASWLSTSPTCSPWSLPGSQTTRCSRASTAKPRTPTRPTASCCAFPPPCTGKSPNAGLQHRPALTERCGARLAEAARQAAFRPGVPGAPVE